MPIIAYKVCFPSRDIFQISEPTSILMGDVVQNSGTPIRLLVPAVKPCDVNGYGSLNLLPRGISTFKGMLSLVNLIA